MHPTLDNKKKTASPAYINRMSAATVQALYDRISYEIVVRERYLDPKFTARQLAADLHTNTRYISAVMLLRFDGNFNEVVNSYRIKRALYMMKDRRFDSSTCEYIGLMSGFSSRQTFYMAFQREMAMTPLAYREKINQE